MKRIMFTIALLFILILAIPTMAQAEPIMLNKIDNFTINNASFSWWCEPKALRYVDTKDQVYMTWLSNSVYTGHCDQYIGTYNCDTRNLTKFNLGHVYYIDDHNAPSILPPIKGQPFMVFYTGHRQDKVIRYRIATSPESVAFGEEKTVSFENGLDVGIAYAQVYRIGVKIILITRLDNINGVWAYRISEDNGLTWGIQRTLYEGGEKSYAYMTTQRIKSPPNYILNFVTSDLPDDKKIERHTTQKIQAGRIELQSGNVLDMYNNVLGNIYTGEGLPITPSELTTVYEPTEENENTRLYSVASDDIDHMEILFMSYTTETNGMYKYAYWNGTNFDVNKIVKTGVSFDGTSYFAGGDIGNKGVIGLARENKGKWYFEIWKTNTNGASWEIESVDACLSPQKIIRPMAIDNFSSSKKIPDNSFIYLRGTYSSMREFDTNLIHKNGSGTYVPYVTPTPTLQP